jgi:hypothetical protein
VEFHNTLFSFAIRFAPSSALPHAKSGCNCCIFTTDETNFSKSFVPPLISIPSFTADTAISPRDFLLTHKSFDNLFIELPSQVITCCDAQEALLTATRLFSNQFTCHNKFLKTTSHHNAINEVFIWFIDQVSVLTHLDALTAHFSILENDPAFFWSVLLKDTNACSNLIRTGVSVSFASKLMDAQPRSVAMITTRY